jgi:hypothetical protein
MGQYAGSCVNSLARPQFNCGRNEFTQDLRYGRPVASARGQKPASNAGWLLLSLTPALARR